MSISILATTSDAAQDISTAKSTTAYNATAGFLVRPCLRLSGLNGAGANFTVIVRHNSHTDVKIRDRKYVLAKPTAADTVFGITLDPVELANDEKILLNIVSDNASDTSVGISVSYVNELAVDASLGNLGAMVISTGTGTALSDTNHFGLDNASVPTIQKDYLIGGIIVITGGTGKGQMRSIVGYTSGLNNSVLVDKAWDASLGGVVPDVTSTYVILAGPTGIAGTVANNVPVSSQIKKGVALANFGFVMYHTNGTKATGLVNGDFTVTRSLDGAAFLAGTISAVTEIANGWYRLDFAAADLDAKTVKLNIKATGVKDTDIQIITDP